MTWRLRRAVGRWLGLGAAWAGLLVVGEAAAAGARGAARPGPTPIFGGAEAEICAFPGVVSLDNGDQRCTGALVHPRVVLYAAHCGADGVKIGFGERAGVPDLVVEPELCMVNPDYAGLGDEGADYAFCRLAEPAPVPVLPVAFGCEADLVEPQAPAVIVGFGEATSGAGDGPKRWAAAPVRLVLPGYVEVGGLGEPGVCAGDSGGPALIQVADATWRVFGIASVHASGCGGIGHYAYAWDAVPWVEAAAGVDLTPCHADDGSWAPSFRCRAFAPADSAGVGTWADLCAASPASPASTSCGPAYDALPDTSPPTITIVSPSGEPLPGPEATVMLEVRAADEGWGVAQVALEIDGVAEAVADEPPFALGTAMFSEGSFTLVAVAEDAAGLSTRSAPVVLVVGDDPDATSEGEGETEGQGCGCAAGPAAGGLMHMSLGSCFAIIAVRRRRRRRRLT